MTNLLKQGLEHYRGQVDPTAPLRRVTIQLTPKEMDMIEAKCKQIEKNFGFYPTTKQQGDMYKHAYFVHNK